MDINWYGHACFRLRGKDIAVITDPYDASAGYGNLKGQAGVVTVSCQLPRNSNASAVPDSRKVLIGPGEYEIGGLMITGVATSRPDEEHPTVPRNTAYLIEIDEVTVCHLGELSRVLTREEIDELKDTEVLLLPVGGHGSLTPAQAAQVVSQLEPKVIIPMRYATETGDQDLDPVDGFCREMGLESPTVQPRASVTKSSLPDEPTVILLEPRKP